MKNCSTVQCKVFAFICFFSSLYLFSCKSTNTPNPEPIESNNLILADCPIPIERGKIYGDHGKKEDIDSILIELKKILSDVCEGNLKSLPELVFEELGLYIEVKGHWTKEEVLKDLNANDGYFATYFFNQSLLDQKKGTSGNITVQTVIRSSHGITVDYFFDSAKETELQLKFKENPKNARYLVNPVFGKINGKWMLLRMF